MHKIADVCVFTIVSNNYLHYANTLFDSVKEHCPEADMFLGLCDEITEATACACDGIIEIKDLDIPSIGQFIYQYTILELNTAMKPYLISLLMDRGYSKVIYFDPDIKIFSPLTEMLSYLDNYNILLTPHLTNTICDDKSPGELQILQAGSYNLGYIGLSASEETRKLVAWWQEKLFRDCVVDLPRGLFVDQKWMDLVPSMFDGVKIVRDNGWNTAYWNLSHRTVTKTQDNTFFVNGVPLMFFHYSGYSIEAKTLSKHQNRHTKTSEGAAVRQLCDIYDSCLEKNGIDHFSKLPYAFSTFADGTPVPDAARGIIRSTRDEFESVDFFEACDSEKIHNLLNLPAEGTKSSPVLITRLLEWLWMKRPDLQAAFPDYKRTNSVGYVTWAIASTEVQAGFTSVYLRDIEDSLEKYKLALDETAPEKGSLNIASRTVRYVWDHRELIPLSLRLALGKDITDWAVSKSYPKNSGELTIATRELGINLIGYMQAESGVGEAARSSLRALESSDLPYCVIDYRLGNTSRMSEELSCDYSPRATYSVNLLHVNADQSAIANDYLGADIVSGRYNIGFWYWEMPEFPEKYDFAFEQVDEIWVATNYVKSSVSARTKKPVTLILPNVQLKFDCYLTRGDQQLPEDDYIYLHMSDVLSMYERKNPLGVIDAFCKAFSDRPEARVHLVMKVSNLDKQKSLKDEIGFRLENENRITLIENYLCRNEVNNLLKNTDCYVSLHRAEGFGLPIAEAMSLGKPAIATGWSGNVDFMNRENSFPVSYELVTLESDFGPYPKGATWAEPCISDAAKKMITVFEDRRFSRSIGEKAKESITSKYGPENTANAMKIRLSAIDFQSQEYGSKRQR